DGYKLTLKGRTQVEKSLRALKKEKIDIIFSSPITRTKETAEIIGASLGKTVHYDARLCEVNVGDFEGGREHAYHDYFSSHIEKFTKRPPNGETLSDLRRRMMDFIEEIEKKLSGKKILIVSHEYPIWMLASGSLGWSNEATIEAHSGGRADDFIRFAEIQKLSYKNLPRDATGAVNLHRPYVDTFLLSCQKCKKTMKRVSEVIDVWFDSGAMPFAQAHWPFAKVQNSPKLLFPADYISEAVDQTRGWFYTLLAVSTLLGKGTSYKNVISLGHVLDKNGQKMSKSKGNAISPDEMIQKYGADAIRWYFYTINSPGDPKKFDEKDLQNKLRGFLGTLWNSFVLFDTYVSKIAIVSKVPKSKNILDQWILARLPLLGSLVSKALDTYDINTASRSIEDFVVVDFSQWYLRRSRRRFQKPASKKEYDEAATVTAYVLVNLIKLTAPFTPFVSEIIWQELRKKGAVKEASVHLSSWPKPDTVSSNEPPIIGDMKKVRDVVAETLKLRAISGIKVRQPLGLLSIADKNLIEK
ncbi:MAG: class I tRNA ligase family protein, partial [Candidatus Sungbacteria bacterium]|nr:class I tRNA ligase family protein [Candidatus Sungbacteria bacterium]